LLFCEHSRRNSKNWFNSFVNEIKYCQLTIKKKCQLLIGTEVKILDLNGNLDINEEIKKRCDLVIASVHRFPGEKNITENTLKIKKQKAIQIEKDLLTAAIRNSDADIIGHPFGMSIKRFKIDPPWNFFVDIIKDCRKNNKIFEINYYYHKNTKKLVNECIKNKTLFSIGSNAHNKDEILK